MGPSRPFKGSSSGRSKSNPVLDAAGGGGSLLVNEGRASGGGAGEWRGDGAHVLLAGSRVWKAIPGTGFEPSSAGPGAFG